MSTPDPTAVTAAMWDAVYARDWDAIASHLADDAVYLDVPTGPAAAAKGPKAIVGRLQLGIEPLVRYEHVHGRVACTDDVVMVEHAEIWGWETGEEVTLPFVSVHRVKGDKVIVWKDYWNYDSLLGAAPEWWKERIFGADLWWLHDASDDPRL
ncbi:MAG: nuclear transport factor 2 family protein [Iamia sp.]